MKLNLIARNRFGSFLLLGLVGLALFPTSGEAQSAPTPAIADNSFLIEEAYNQEAGVVQHILVWQWNEEDRSWGLGFTQEWPLFSKEHQLSYTIPVSHVDDPSSDTGVGDIAFNYRYQLIDESNLAIAPRASLIIPTGDEDKGLGAGSVGFQANLPVSYQLSPTVVTHWNLGMTINPDEHDTEGNSDSTVSYNYGASIIYLAQPELNYLLEFMGNNEQDVDGANSTTRFNEFTINPGVRAALNYPSGMQIVPGLSFPIGMGRTSGEWGVLLYLSIEHDFL